MLMQPVAHGQQQAVLPKQFDEYIWFDRTAAVEPNGAARVIGDSRYPNPSDCNQIAPAAFEK
jgi:hypothetical protein